MVYDAQAIAVAWVFGAAAVQLWPITRVTENAYDALGRLVRVTEAKGVPGFSRTTARGYDAADNPVWEATPRKYAYDPTPAAPTDRAAVRKIASDNATVPLNRYDGLNRKTHTTEAANAVGKLGHAPPETRWTYDKAGRIWVEEGPPVSGPTGMPSR